MAVPKKRLSKTKSRIRKSDWKKKGLKHVTKALSLAKSLIKKLPS
jgi:ribosomal protein L32|uniref:Large ribosomal subunit protein bL32c n=1 Tax=Microthamnion kuetzingianum TaxID=34148 RepID=A0A097KNG0_9CHLO|nr:ribosomal protein L32 [Microthamnion kuetzingianum]AIT94713.1 ribosomal protein L32 [Microthamnion kuetzingianum]